MSDPHSHGSSGSPGSPAGNNGQGAPTVPHDAAHFHDHSKLYLLIGGLLMAGTGLTVWFSYLDFGSHEANIFFGLALATVKATLVALVFMHLKEEKMTIYQFMLVTMIFVSGLFGLTLLAFKDHIHFPLH